LLINKEQLAAIPEFAHLGQLFKSSAPIDLTEPDTEYTVKCIKHIFSNYVVFQFDCTNTLNDQLLEKVSVKMDTSDGYEVISYISCEKLPYNVTTPTYTLVKIPDDPTQGLNLNIKYQNKTKTILLINYCLN
jgi:coatomer subunit gamma